jgi:hypothetical protein
MVAVSQTRAGQVNIGRKLKNIALGAVCKVCPLGQSAQSTQTQTASQLWEPHGC